MVVLEPVPRWIEPMILESKCGREIDQASHTAKQLRHDLKAGLVRQPEKDKIEVEHTLKLERFEDQVGIGGGQAWIQLGSQCSAAFLA